MNDSTRMTAIRNVFAALFDAVDVAGEFEETKWEDLIAAFNAVGRLVFGWPHLESCEEDFFYAMTEITDDLNATKAAIEQTTEEARIVMHELHEVVGPPDEPEPAPIIPAAIPETEPVVPEPTQTSEIEPEQSSIEPVQPSPDDERMFESVRSGAAASYADIDRLLDWTSSRAYGRFALLARYGTLPEDMVVWRETRRGKVGRRGKTTAAATYQPSITAQPRALVAGETFEERRQRAASERADLTWRERHPEEARA